MRALRAPAHSADGVQLLDTAAAALDACVEDIRETGLAGVTRLLNLDDLAQPHLRRMVLGVLDPEDGIAPRAHEAWLAGGRFLTALLIAYRETPALLNPAQLQRSVRVELLVRRLRAGANLLHWRAYAYFPGDSELWSEIVSAYVVARENDLAGRQVALKPGRKAQTSVEREFARAIALGCASLDQLSPDGIDIVDRLIRYIVPALSISGSRGKGAAYSVSLKDAGPPRRVVGSDLVEQGVLYLLPASAAAVLEELASVIAKGLVPAALASGPMARERVLSVIHHLRRLWSSAPPMRRHRRHSLAGKLRAIKGFHHIQNEIMATAPASEAGHWDMLDASRNGIGIVVPADDCDRLAVGDLLGVQAEDGQSWHVAVVRRIVRSEDGTGIVGVESIARSAVPASIDDGKSPAGVLLLDPVRRGTAIRLAQAIPSDGSTGAVFLNQDGRICKLRPLSRLLRGDGFEVLNYHVL